MDSKLPIIESCPHAEVLLYIFSVMLISFLRKMFIAMNQSTVLFHAHYGNIYRCIFYRLHFLITIPYTVFLPFISRCKKNRNAYIYMTKSFYEIFFHFNTVRYLCISSVVKNLFVSDSFNKISCRLCDRFQIILFPRSRTIIFNNMHNISSTVNLHRGRSY